MNSAIEDSGFIVLGRIGSGDGEGEGFDEKINHVNKIFFDTVHLFGTPLNKVHTDRKKMVSDDEDGIVH